MAPASGWVSMERSMARDVPGMAFSLVPSTVSSASMTSSGVSGAGVRAAGSPLVPGSLPASVPGIGFQAARANSSDLEP